MTCGIYKIENLINHKVYIGQSRNIEKRWNKHCNTMQNSSDHSYENPLYRAMRKYGIENFNFSILEECSIQDLDEREKYWINETNSYFNGYNLTFGGDGSGYEITKQSIIGIFQDLKDTDLLQREIAEKWNISEEMVQGINTGRYWKQDDIEYPIRLRKQAVQHYCCNCGKPIDHQAIRCVSCARIASRKAIRPSRQELKEKIRNESFVKIASEYGVSDKAITKWCIAEGLPSKKKDIKLYSDEDWDKI